MSEPPMTSDVAVVKPGDLDTVNLPGACPPLTVRSFGLTDRGRLALGQRADFVAWDLEHPNELAYWFGRNPCRRVVAAGVPRKQTR